MLIVQDNHFIQKDNICKILSVKKIPLLQKKKKAHKKHEILNTRCDLEGCGLNA